MNYVCLVFQSPLTLKEFYSLWFFSKFTYFFSILVKKKINILYLYKVKSFAKIWKNKYKVQRVTVDESVVNFLYFFKRIKFLLYEEHFKVNTIQTRGNYLICYFKGNINKIIFHWNHQHMKIKKHPFIHATQSNTLQYMWICSHHAMRVTFFVPYTQKVNHDILKEI